MRLKRLIKHFDFTPNIRADLELGEGVRLDPKYGSVMIEEDNGYSTSTDLYFKTWVANPNNVKGWLGFECVIENSRSETDYNTYVTGANFRLHDGIDEYWYNGSDWVVDNINWNTESEISDNIQYFPYVERKIGVVVNPYTTDSTKTPIINSIKVLYNSNIEHFDDYVYRTIVKSLKAGLRPLGDHIITLAANTNTIDMDDITIDTPYNIIDIDSVYNYTDDPECDNDILSSYNTSTRVITLSETVDSGKKLWIKFVYVPEVIVSMGLEYKEIGKLPSIVLTNVNMVNEKEINGYDFVINKSTGTAVKVPAPRCSDLDISAYVTTNSARDQVRLATELQKFFANNTYLVSWGLDEKFDIRITELYDGQIGDSQDGVNAGRLRFLMMGTLYYEIDAVDVYAISEFQITGDIDVTV